MKEQNNNQLDLMAFGGIKQDSYVLATFELNDNDKSAQGGGRTQSLKRKKRKEIAHAANLTLTKENKSKIDALELRGKDALKGDLAVLFAKLANDPNFTGSNLRISTPAKGKTKIAFVLEAVERPSGQTLADIAAKYGKTEAELLELLAGELKEVQTIDVPTEKVAANPEQALQEAFNKADEPELTQEEKDAAELARMEREEAEKTVAAQ